MMEALVCHPLGMYNLFKKSNPRSNSNLRYHQSAYAAFSSSTRSRRKETRLPDYWCRDREERNTTWSIQRIGSCCYWYRAEDGHSILEFRGIQEIDGGQRDWQCQWAGDVFRSVCALCLQGFSRQM